MSRLFPIVRLASALICILASGEGYPKVKVLVPPAAPFKTISHPEIMIPLNVFEGTLEIVPEAMANSSTSSSEGIPAGVHLVISFQSPLPPTQLRVCDHADIEISTIITRE